MTELLKEGWMIVPARLERTALETLRSSAFSKGSAGQRCLLDDDAVRQTAVDLRRELISAGTLPKTAVAIQAIAFDKNPTTNWKVTWHQDLMFPFARKVESPDYTLPSIKDGIDYARPPREVMDELLAVRLHLDDCDETNGPLRVASGSHRHGIFKGAEIPAMLQQSQEVACLAKEGEVLLMKPLLLHASSPATAPKHRRVLHFVYHSGNPIAEVWHRSI
jgi:ectoine hydroxylase-related dioxygenase (phytanoyl-CoA dioxygenase family)